MGYVTRKDETEPVLRISRDRLIQILDITDPVVRKAAVDLLQKHDLIRRHRISRAREGEPVDAWTLPPGWGSEHLLHLRRRARTLLDEQGVRTDKSGVGRVLRW